MLTKEQRDEILRLVQECVAVGNEGGDKQAVTLRDYFAAKAVCGPLSRGLGYDARADETRAEWTARKAYEYADAMLAAREK